MHLSLGTAAIGRPQYINIRKETPPPFEMEAFKAKGKRVLDEAWRLGIRYYDTAPGYGMAETLLLEWLQENKQTEAEVATKWGYTYTANFDPQATQHEVKEHSLTKLNEQWAASQKLLPQLSTYQIHSATFETGVLENTAVLNRLQKLKARHGLLIGITTTGANQMAVIQKAMEVEIDGVALFDTFQLTYNLLDQSLAAVAKDLKQAGKRIIIKEALANGRLFPNTRYPHYAPLYQTLREMAQKYEVGIDAIALRFCMDRLQPFTVLSGAANAQQLTENLKATRIQLKPEDLEALPRFQIPPEVYWQERKELEWN